MTERVWTEQEFSAAAADLFYRLRWMEAAIEHVEAREGRPITRDEIRSLMELDLLIHSKAANR